jgi:hypothetical protein
MPDSLETLLGVACGGARGGSGTSLGLLGSTTTAATDGTTTSTTREASARLAREATATTRAASEAVTTEALLGAELALLDLDLETIHRVRVGVDSSLEGGRRLEVYESAVLERKD